MLGCKTIEIYTYVRTQCIKKVKFPFDNMEL